MHDCLLGGKDNFAADRAAIAEPLRARPLAAALVASHATADSSSPDSAAGGVRAVHRAGCYGAAARKPQR